MFLGHEAATSVLKDRLTSILVPTADSDFYSPFVDLPRDGAQPRGLRRIQGVWALHI